MTGATEITMPRLADGMEQGTIVAWLVAAGMKVTVGDEIVEIETDKAAMAYAAEAEGYLEIVAAPGETVAVGGVIARLSLVPAGAVPDSTPQPEAFPHAADSAPASSAPAEPARESISATPLARRLAAAHGVELAAISGTGPRGRITRGDVAAHAGILPKREKQPPRRDAHAAPRSSGSNSRGGANRGAGSTQQLSRLQQTIARRMAESKATIPHFQIQAEATVDALLDLRAQLKREKTLHPVPSINDLIVKAAGLALREFPLANGTFRDGSFELHEQVNVGIAVAARDALVVPVISAADSRPIAEISTEARRLAERVRDGSVTPPELAGGTFTVSNLGMFGMSAIFPVINPGQGAILGVGASRGVAVIRDGELAEQQLLTLTLSCDHRILYGAEAAQFLGRIVGLLERPLQLLL